MQGCLCAESSPGVCTTSAWTHQLWITACQSTRLYKGSWSSSRSQDFPWFAGDRCGNFWHARCYVMTCGTTVTTYDTAAWVSVAGSSGWNIKKNTQQKPKCEKKPTPTPASTAISIYTEEKGADQATSVTDTLFSSLMKCPDNFNSKELLSRKNLYSFPPFTCARSPPRVAAFANIVYSLEPRTEEHCRLVLFHRQKGNSSICLTLLIGCIFLVSWKTSSGLKIIFNKVDSA